MQTFINNKKYNAILETSKELFWKFGFRRVTIEEICREANTSKMTFYRFFPNKTEVAKAVIDKVVNEEMIKIKEIFHEESSTAEKMKNLIQLKHEGIENISDEFLDDFYSNLEPELAQYMEGIRNRSRIEYIKLFRDGQDKGWVRKDMNLEFMFIYFQSLMPLLKNSRVLSLYNSTQDLVMEIANMCVYGISSKE